MMEGLLLFLFPLNWNPDILYGLEMTKYIFDLKTLNSTISRESGEWRIL